MEPEHTLEHQEILAFWGSWRGPRLPPPDSPPVLDPHLSKEAQVRVNARFFWLELVLSGAISDDFCPRRLSVPRTPNSVFFHPHTTESNVPL